jgi:FemAB-related protein (PEP-CTERM system-associated)
LGKDEVTILDVRVLDKSHEDEWDDYILHSKSSHFYHQIGWRNVVHKTYKHKPIYLVAYENRTIRGGLPLFLMKSMIFGKRLISTPFGPYGGTLSDDENIKDALLSEAKKLTLENKLDYLELRYPHPPDLDLPQQTLHFTMVLELNNDSEVVWKKLDKKVRNSTRKAMKSGLIFSLDREHLHDFYNLYAFNMRELGTPVHKYGFFLNLLDEFPEKVYLANVHLENKIIAGAIILTFKDTMISGWAASDSRFLNMNPNNILYWETIKYGCENGYKYFDFGRSVKGSGTYNFKKKWATIPKQLYYSFYLNKAREIPRVDPHNPKYEKSIKRWRRLPFWITKILGPRIRKHVP